MALWKHGEPFGIDTDAAGRLDQYIVDAFQADGLVLQNLGYQIGGFVHIAATNDQQYPLLRTFDQAAGGFQRGDTGSFRAHERAGNMEAVFGKEKRQVVAGNSAGNVRILLADEARVLAANRFQSRVNLGATASLADDVIELGFVSRAYAHA